MMQYMDAPLPSTGSNGSGRKIGPPCPSRERREQPEPDSRPAEDPQWEARRRRRRLIIAAIVGAALLLAASVLGWYWYTTWRWLESTDDAYTQADNTAIVPRVYGYISELLVTDNQRVKAGEVLLRIDPRDYQAAVDQAQSDVLRRRQSP